MLESLLISTLLYPIMMVYLNKRYDTQQESQKDLWKKNKKRELSFAGIYLAITFAGGWLFPIYGYSVIETAKYLLVMEMLWVIAYIDYREQIIPNTWVIGIMWLAVLFLAADIIGDSQIILSLVIRSVGGMLFAGGIFLCAKLFSKSGIGMGDVKLFGVLGLYLGSYTVTGVMLLSLLIAACSGVLLLLRKKITLKGEMPFAPYVALGTTLALLLGC